ncbi:MAG: thioesterase family protein [bacterium]
MHHEHKLQIRVSYAETDQMGVVYYSNYFIWFERGRTELLREMGLPYKDFEKKNIFLPVVDASCSYRASAHYDDIIIVHTKIKKVGKSSIVFSYEISRKGEEKILAQGETTHAFINTDKKVVAIPEEIRNSLKA